MSGFNLWAIEVHNGIVSLGFKVEKTLFTGQSRFQKVDILKTTEHGIVLMNDGLFMLSEKDEFVYHEMIAHVPMFVHPCPKKVLVIGGGDGGAVREILKHPQIEKVVLVEIDELVVNACRKYMPFVSYALDDPKVQVVIDDGVKYVAKTKEKFDVVIVDSTDPIGPSKPLFDKSFYKNVAGLLCPDGILVTQAESPFYDSHIQGPMLMNQRQFFKKLHLYLYTTITYPGGLWAFSFASDRLCPVGDFDPERVDASNISTRYYNSRMHMAAFALPNFLSEQLAKVIDPVAYRF
ncbi:MAG: spermidine synthase [Desulfobacteraceae bacterium IS3]|nr:MAG: spermidine synthase [Desulfobacteraceae bacterium IS3]